MPTRTPGQPPDILVLGELLIDLFPPAAGVPIQEASHLVPHPGGAPANVAAHLAHRGASVGLITAVGDDPLGARALRELDALGVDLRRVARRAGLRTGLTLVEVDADGERRFTPWRVGSADLTLREDELGAIAGARLLHHGTVSLREAPARDATLAAVARARDAGALVSVDVNLRAGMYPDPAELRAAGELGLAGADIVKATRDEAVFLGAPDEVGAAARWLVERGARLALVSDGAAPAAAASARGQARAAPPTARVVDATGAGDAFTAAALAWLLGREIDALEPEPLRDLLEVANAAGAAACGHLGAGPTSRTGS